MKIDWIKKLTSRKLWLSIASFVSMLLVALGGTDSEAAQVSALIMAGATVIAYIVGEGLNDAAFNNTTLHIVKDDEEEKSEEE